MVDSNANVSSKNICTLMGELHKDFNIQLKRKLVTDNITKLFGKELSEEYLRQLKDHEIYCHDESGLAPYCCSASLYPFLLNGMKGLGGEAGAPKHLSSFCGNYVNLMFALSSQLLGAVGAPETLMCFDYFARKDYGEDYADWFTVPKTEQQKNDAKEIENHLQSVVYAINQPAAARGYQSIFCNWSVFDKYYFKAIFEDFVFPDFTPTNWESLEKLQRFFLKWINKERTKALLTFPVITASVLTSDGKPKDEEFARFLAKELSEGNSFFMFMSKNPQAISSCCRLSNEMTDTTFSNSSGAGGVSTGSMNVITININRLVQNAVKDNQGCLVDKLNSIKNVLSEQVLKLHKYQVATKTIFDDLKTAKMLPLYDAGFVTMKKQYLTVGVNGVLEGAESLGIEPSYNEDYKKYLKAIFETISSFNKQAKETWKDRELMFNLEMVPAENLGVKFAGWDKKDGYVVKREAYNSYLYRVEDQDINIIDKFRLYEEDISKTMDGGSAVHLNLLEYPDKEAYYKLMCLAASLGVPYWCTNIAITCCEEEDCKHINKFTSNHCVKCGSPNVSHATRIIGYLRKNTSFSKARQNENILRFYHKIFKNEEFVS
ncbi:MAG: anaerobic ribonucleoside-triphosphate reductase [Bacteroidales bacterium]|nr:anaerobic ribonucleoside-triphosphate reductase [Bacteroidales bacterium]